MQKNSTVMSAAAIVSVIIAFAAFTSLALMSPQHENQSLATPSSSSSMTLALNYTIEDHMIYEVTNVLT